MAKRDNGNRAVAFPYRTGPFLIALFLAAPGLIVPRAARAQSLAQQNRPVSLLPGTNGLNGGQKKPGASASQPATAAPAAHSQNGATANQGATAASTPASTPAEAKAAGNGIGIGTLAAPNPADIGVLDTSQGALPPSLWQGSSAATVAMLLPKLPVSDSPGMQSLATRLLLSPGAAPTGTAKGPSLLALRVRALLALGQVPGALALVKAANTVEDPAFSRAAVDTYWLSGETHAACGRVLEMVRESAGNGMVEDSAFCHLLAGQQAAAGIDVGLLHDQKGIAPAFFELYDRLTGFRRKPVASLADPTPLLLAMLAATKDPPPATLVDGAEPAVAYFVARMAHAPLPLRLTAGEQAAAQGGLAPKMLRKLYASVSYSEADFADAAKVAARFGDARGNALMYQAAVRETEPLAKAEALQTSFALAKKLSGSVLPVFRADEKQLMALTPSRDLAWFAPAAARALLELGRPKAAAAWYALIAGGMQAADTAPNGSAANVTAGDSDPKDDAGPAARLAPLMMLAGATTADPAQGLAVWYAAMGSDPAQRDAEAGLLFTLSDALGEKVPEALWKPLYRHTSLAMEATPQPALRHGLARAASAKLVGATVLFSLVNIGPGGPTVASAATLAHVITALDAVGLDADARQIAVEAALGGV